MHPDYLNLSGQYASFLSALGGISITVLAIVLAIRNPDKTKYFSVLVNALLVATLACFVGSHLMAQTAAMRPKEQKAAAAAAPTPSANPPDAVRKSSPQAATPSAEQKPQQQAQDSPPAEKKKALGVRYFIYASVNVYFALMLVGFAIMLLPWVFLWRGRDEREKARDGQGLATGAGSQGGPAPAPPEGGMAEKDFAATSIITKVVFYFVVISAYFWSFYYHDFRFPESDAAGRFPKAFVFGTIIILAIWVAYLYLLRYVIEGTHLVVSTFILHILLIGCSVCLFAFLADIEPPAASLDIWFFCAAIGISGASLWGLRLRLYESRHTRYRPFKWRRDLGDRFQRWRRERRERAPRPEDAPPVTSQGEQQEDTDRKGERKAGKKSRARRVRVKKR